MERKTRLSHLGQLLATAGKMNMSMGGAAALRLLHAHPGLGIHAGALISGLITRRKLRHRMMPDPFATTQLDAATEQHSVQLDEARKHMLSLACDLAASRTRVHNRLNALPASA